MISRLACLFFCVAAAGCDTFDAAPPASRPETRDAPPRADNTARNERDKGDATLTPMDQSESGPDIAITAEIRRAILADTSLSSNAANIKIITSGGVVTLRGPVNSTGERAAIEAKAKAVAGVTRVDNQLETTP